MKLSARLSLLMAVTALGPLAFLGVGTTEVAKDRVRARVEELQARTASGLALYVDTWLELQLRLIGQQLTAFPLDGLSDAERVGLLRLVYRQTPQAHIVSLLTPGGVDVVPSAYAGTAEAAAALRREVISAERMRAFRQASLALLREGAPPAPQAGAPYVPPGRAAPVLPILASAGGAVLAVELGLDPIAARLEQSAAPDLALGLLDAQGKAWISAGPPLVSPAAFEGLRGGAAEAIRYRTPEGQAVLAACEPVAQTGWTVVVAAPAAVVAASGRDIQLRASYIAAVAALLSVVLGTRFARQISGPIEGLRDAALAVAEGRLGQQVQPQGGARELVELERSFNLMSASLARNAREIAAQQAEIEAFNRELQQRVEERTAALRQAQDRLVQSARLAAVGELGAGMAHELNNPLAGILGLAQLLRARAPDERMLALIEEQALRCKDIVSRLQRLAAQEAPLDRAEQGVVDLAAVLEEALNLVGSPLRQRAIEITALALPALPVRGDRTALVQALAQLLMGLRALLPGGGALQVSGACADGTAELAFTLVGRVEGRTDDWMAAGMGLWAARQVVAAHGGQLREPAPGDVSWLVQLPAA